MPERNVAPGRLGGLALASVVACSNVAASATTVELTDLAWERRVILIFTGPAEPVDASLEQALKRYACHIRDRDLNIYSVGQGSVTPLTPAATPIDDGAASLRGIYASSEGGRELVLIGKDGGIKARGRSLEALPTFFGLIDGMPMRRAEQRSRGLECG
ncbi:MAG: DUF4174 domain-containing protein [Pseudomonadota bacterium]